jgi:hypothetical protein
MSRALPLYNLFDDNRTYTVIFTGIHPSAILKCRGMNGDGLEGG